MAEEFPFPKGILSLEAEPSKAFQNYKCTFEQMPENFVSSPLRSLKISVVLALYISSCAAAEVINLKRRKQIIKKIRKTV